MEKMEKTEWMVKMATVLRNVRQDHRVHQEIVVIVRLEYQVHQAQLAIVLTAHQEKMEKMESMVPTESMAKMESMVATGLMESMAKTAWTDKMVWMVIVPVIIP